MDNIVHSRPTDSKLNETTDTDFISNNNNNNNEMINAISNNINVHKIKDNL